MYTKTLISSFLLSSIVLAIPMADQNMPITDAEYEALASIGLGQRDTGHQKRDQNVAITDAEYAALAEMGIGRRDLEVRDNVLNCGKDVTGKNNIGGHHVGWVPWAQFNASITQFCNGYVGTSISKGHETSDTYPVSLTNQDDPNIPGDAGNVVFAIYNTARDSGYTVDAQTCLTAMQAPILAYYNKHQKSNGKGNQCYGVKNNDVEGGYYEVSGIGAFGSEVKKASS